MAAVYGTADDAAEAAQDEIIPDAYMSLPEVKGVVVVVIKAEAL